jgi:arginine/ornithine N-succinyltransferase beta subunit
MTRKHYTTMDMMIAAYLIAAANAPYVLVRTPKKKIYFQFETEDVQDALNKFEADTSIGIKTLHTLHDQLKNEVTIARDMIKVEASNGQ